MLSHHLVGRLATQLLSLLTLLLQCLLPETEPAVLYDCVHVNACFTRLLAAPLVVLLHFRREQELLAFLGGPWLRVLAEPSALSHAEFGTLVIQLAQ